MPTTTTVVTKQVTRGGTSSVHTTGNREWSTGVLGCFSDCKTMCCGLLCLPCLAGRVSQRMGEHCCVPCIVPGGPITMRTKLRLMLGIQGSICKDCVTTLCCVPCVVCQMQREMDHAGW